LLMRNLFKVFILSIVAVFFLAACGSNDETAEEETNTGEGPLKVVTTFSILDDMVSQIGGELVDVHNLVPIGTDPHDYEPLPEDIKAATDADVLFYNGLSLEGGDSGWFAKLIDSVGKDQDAIFKAAEDV